jgi:hypothetical protein
MSFFSLPTELRSRIYGVARVAFARDVVGKLLERRRAQVPPPKRWIGWKLSDTKTMSLFHAASDRMEAERHENHVALSRSVVVVIDSSTVRVTLRVVQERVCLHMLSSRVVVHLVYDEVRRDRQIDYWT